MLKAGLSFIVIGTLFCIYTSTTLIKEYLLNSNANIAS